MATHQRLVMIAPFERSQYVLAMRFGAHKPNSAMQSGANK
jgi:hypothetical protein